MPATTANEIAQQFITALLDASNPLTTATTQLLRYLDLHHQVTSLPKRYIAFYNGWFLSSDLIPHHPCQWTPEDHKLLATRLSRWLDDVFVEVSRHDTSKEMTEVFARRLQKRKEVPLAVVFHQSTAQALAEMRTRHRRLIDRAGHVAETSFSAGLVEVEFLDKHDRYKMSYATRFTLKNAKEFCEWLQTQGFDRTLSTWDSGMKSPLVRFGYNPENMETLR